MKQSIYEQVEIIDECIKAIKLEYEEVFQDLDGHALHTVSCLEATKTLLESINRGELLNGRHHLTESEEFQSDKYEWCPAGFVPLKIVDPLARDLLAQYAIRRQYLDSDFTLDLLEALSLSEPVKSKEKNHD